MLPQVIVPVIIDKRLPDARNIAAYQSYPEDR